MYQTAYEATAKALASTEISWWKAHHVKDGEKLIENKAKNIALLLNTDVQNKVTYEHSKNCMKYFHVATHLHDLAEKYQDEGDKEKSDRYWNMAEELLENYFLELLRPAVKVA